MDKIRVPCRCPERPPINPTPDLPTPALRAADFSLLFVAAVWGVNMAVMKLAINEMDLFLFNAIRLSLSALVLGACVWLESARTPTRPVEPPPGGRVRFWLTILVFALLTGGAYQIVFALGISKTTAGNTALIMSSMPMWTAMLSFVLLHEKLGAAWYGLLVTFSGTVVVTLEKGINLGSEHLWGNLLVLVAALAWSIAAVVSRPMLRYISPIRLAFYATLGTLPVHWMITPYLSSVSSVSVLEPWLLGCLLYSGIFSTGIAYAMWNYGVQQLGPSHASVYQNLVPLIALLAAFAILGERFSWLQVAGGAMIIAGLVLTRRWRPANAQPGKQPVSMPTSPASIR